MSGPAQTPVRMPTGMMGLRALAEMAALHARSRLGDLSNAESEKLGQLVLREQRLSRGRGMLIARVRAVLAMLEDLEIAERGTLDVPAPGRTIEHRAEAA